MDAFYGVQKAGKSDPAKPGSSLRHGPLGAQVAHLCIDMQNVFLEETEWQTAWMPRVLPSVRAIAEHRPACTIFTRFIPPEHPEDVRGVWRGYYERWRQFTRAMIDPRLLELVPELAALVPPARVIDKAVYSPFHDPTLLEILRGWGADTLVVTGAETDVCVGATVFAAMDHGFRVVVVRDALCGSADETHDAQMRVYADRFNQQIELVESETVLEQWV